MALTRVDALLGDSYVHDIVSQRETTIDFAKAFDEKKIILITLSDRLSTDVKTFIDTISISELVHAVKMRSTANPDQFCVYVDEFQNFSERPENVEGDLPSGCRGVDRLGEAPEPMKSGRINDRICAKQAPGEAPPPGRWWEQLHGL